LGAARMRFPESAAAGLARRLGERKLPVDTEVDEAAGTDLSFDEAPELGSTEPEPARGRRIGWARRLLGLGRRRPDAPKRLLGRVIHREGDLIVIEYETPSDGFMCPHGAVAVVDAHGQTEVALTDPLQSSPPGPHKKGVLLRLALRRPDGWTMTGT